MGKDAHRGGGGVPLLDDRLLQHPLLVGLEGEGGIAEIASRRAWGYVADGIAEALTVTGLPGEERASLLRSYWSACRAAGRPHLSQLRAQP